MEKSILIIDDDQDILGVLEDVLVYSHFKVRAELQAKHVFEVIEDFKPDLVLIDYILNGINGGEICHQIKNNKDTSHLPVILISAYPRVLESLGRYGCDAFIAKPFDINNLISSINDCVGIPA